MLKLRLLPNISCLNNFLFNARNLKLQLLRPNAFDHVQAPSQIGSLFNGRRVTAYAFVPNCQQARLKASINGHEVSTVVTCPDLLISRDGDDLLHKLAAKALIDDWQYGLLCEENTLASQDKVRNDLRKLKLKEKIIRLSIKYSITSEYTSFLAIEDRDKVHDKLPASTMDMSALLCREAVDILPYMAYEDKDLESVAQLVSQIDQAKMSEAEHDTLFKFLIKNKAEIRDGPLSLKCALLLSNEYKRKGDYVMAMSECKNAFDGCIAELDCLSEDTYKEVGSSIFWLGLG